jgi:hypothetical protein
LKGDRMTVTTWHHVSPLADMRDDDVTTSIDLVARFATSDRRPAPDAFSVVDAEIAGRSRKAVRVRAEAAARLTWTETIPAGAELRVSLGLAEESSRVDGDGVLFRIGISAGADYEERLVQLVNPRSNAMDRRWRDVSIDLSGYAGQVVNIVFNTRSSVSAKDDRRGDAALWGDPRVVIRR